ncbi:MAG: type II toxin-antitoxin system RelE/ParE family toxin [Fretibacterium sp.]|nr:type II toxin-antitoxin system RelE/ParE family toxin [Fretibacterium sp.]
MTRWKVEFQEKAQDALLRLDRTARERIRQYVRRLRESDNPRTKGAPLRGSLSGLWKYRVGDYRLVCQIKDDVLIVLVVWLGP